MTDPRPHVPDGGGPEPAPEHPETDQDVGAAAAEETAPTDETATDSGAAPPAETEQPEADEADEAATAPSGDAPEEDDPAALRAALEQVTAERDTYLANLQRARADYDNLNKRKNRELMGALDRGGAAVAERLLEVLDTFGFALQAAAESEDAQLAKGVTMVHDQLLAALQECGLEEVPGVGAPFDPEHHEALMQTEDGEDRDEPVVAEVLRTGYRFRGQLLRPAAVKVVR